MQTNQLRFKQIDLIVQLLILLTTGGLYFVDSNTAFISLYFVFGGWQFMSMLVHLIAKWNNDHLLRRIYLYALLAVVIIFLISLAFVTLMIWLFYLLLFITPVLGLYYVLVCGLELRLKR